MIELKLIGIGTGNVEHLTFQAVRVLKDADLVLIPRKGADKADLAEFRREVCAVHRGDTARLVEFDLPVRDSVERPYLDGVRDWHAAIADVWAALISTHLPEGGNVALLVWGDPALYDSNIRIAQRLQAVGLALRIEVIPGLSSVQLLTAAHAIPLNTLGAPVLITTGRQLKAGGWPVGLKTMVVLLDGACAFQHLPAQDLFIYWAAYLGMPQQMLFAGPLVSTGPRIVEARAEARRAHGWIMDSYLLRSIVECEKLNIC